MDIIVKNLDLGYEQCESLNNLVKNSGGELVNNLATNIKNLKNHWVASDASKHINNLIVVYDALVALLSDATKISSDVGNRMIAIQEVRSANGGVKTVGSHLSGEFQNTETIAKCDEGITNYYVDPGASADYAMLCEECDKFSKFVEDFNKNKNDLLNNWIAGVNREAAVKNFDTLNSNSQEYENYLKGARDNLEIAVNNISKLQ